MVRRPVDPNDFKGVVVLEWFNVTGQHDARAGHARALGHGPDAGQRSLRSLGGRGDLARHPLCRAAEQAKFGWAEPQPPVTATCPFAPDQALNRRIMLRGLPAGDVRVRIVARTRRGYTVSQTRRYRLCR